MTGYKIATHNEEYRFTGWKVEISIDNINWIKVDEKGDELKNSSFSQSVQINKTDSFSFIKVTQTKPQPDNL
jgi:hypothetical protein